MIVSKWVICSDRITGDSNNKMVNLTKLKNSDKNLTQQLRVVKEQRDDYYKRYLKASEYVKHLEYSKILLKRKIKNEKNKQGQKSYKQGQKS